MNQTKSLGIAIDFAFILWQTFLAHFKSMSQFLIVLEF